LGAPPEDLGPFHAKEELQMGILDEYSAVGNARKSTGISLINTNKETRPRATPIKKF
jgi:hypothetical protein